MIVGGGYILSILLNRLLNAFQANAVRLMVSKGQVADMELEKRTKTIVTVLRRPALTLLWGAVILMALQELGFHVEPLLAGAGVSAGILGVAVGFGAQSMIKDVIAGAFMLLENQIRVNDVAVINNTGGLVEEINLRTTVLRSENGAVHIFPNGSITTLANLTREFAYWVVEIPIRFDEDADRVMAMMRDVVEGMRGDSTYGTAIVGSLDVMGVDRFVANGVMLKARVKTLPQKQWFVGREVNRRLRERFLAAGIQQPSEVMRLEGGLASRESLKAAIREVLGEGPGEV